MSLLLIIELFHFPKLSFKVSSVSLFMRVFGSISSASSSSVAEQTAPDVPSVLEEVLLRKSKAKHVEGDEVTLEDLLWSIRGGTGADPCVVA